MKKYAHNLIKDITGERFNSVSVKKISGRNVHGHILWACVCDCGKAFKTVASALKNGRTKSCGCFRAKHLAKNSQPTHGQSRRGKMSGAYRSWADMVKRCTNPKNWAWKYYGGRGIAVCSEWLTFQNFFNDMGDRPKGLTLDRINNNGNYEKQNCRWATRLVQAQNRRRQCKS